MGEAFPLSVYVMKKIPGTIHVEARFYDESTAEAQLQAESRRLNTVRDCAR